MTRRQVPGWPVVLCGVLACAASLIAIRNGEAPIPAGLASLLAGIILAAHPAMRARWYRIGYADGYNAGVPSFRCPICGRVSYNPNDATAAAWAAEHGYCGACHAFTGDEVTR